MRTVWKFEGQLHTGEVELPKGARILFVNPETRPGATSITFWAEVDPEAPTEKRPFAVYGTGHPIPGDLVYWGTTKISPLGLVFHLYGGEK